MPDNPNEADLVAMERDLERDLAQRNDHSGVSLTDGRHTCA